MQEVLNANVSKFSVTNSWVDIYQLHPGYNKFDFDDSGWLPARIVLSTYNQFINLGVDPKAMWFGTSGSD